MNAEPTDADAELYEKLYQRFMDAEKVLAAPEIGEPGSLDWQKCIVQKQAAIKVMLLDKRLSEFDRQALDSTYDAQQRNLDLLDRQQQRNWEMQQRAKEIELENEYRKLTIMYAETSKKMAESQAEAAKRYQETAETQAESLRRATWVLAFATIILALATTALIFVTAADKGSTAPIPRPDRASTTPH
jgi:hypothetical protein